MAATSHFVTMLGLLGLRICEATGSKIEDLGEEHGHRVQRVRGKGDKVVAVPLPPPWAARSNVPSTTGPPARSCSHAAASAWTATAPPDGTGDSPRTPA